MQRAAFAFLVAWTAAFGEPSLADPDPDVEPRIERMLWTADPPPTQREFRELATWCNTPENHVVHVTDAERAVGVLSESSLAKALLACQQCGFAKLTNAVDKAMLKKLSRKAVKYARAHPNTPMLLQQIATTVEGEIREPKSVWDGGRGRVAMVVPHKRPFIDEDLAAVTNLSLVRAVVDRWLGAPTLGVELEMYQFIVSGRATPEQIAHNDIPLLYPTAASHERRRYHHFPPGLPQSALWPAFRNGTATFAVRVQMPLTVDITEQNGPTVMCPVSHREDFGMRYLKRCDRYFPKASDPDSERRPRHRNAQKLLWDADVCSAAHGRRALGTGRIGDVLIYDGRLTHAGGENKGDGFRDIVALSYAHRWWRDWSRTLTREGNIEELKWRADFRLAGHPVHPTVAGDVAIPKASRKHIPKAMRDEL